jgi:hypothetical protein
LAIIEPGIYALAICPIWKERQMLAAIGLGLIGTILLIVLVIAAIMFFLRRA